MMDRGNVYWVDLNPTIGSEINKLRPCVLVGATPINQARRTVVVVPLSTVAKERPPLTISCSVLEKNVVAVCDQIRAIDKGRLKKSAGKLSHEDMRRLDDVLKKVLSL